VPQLKVANVSFAPFSMLEEIAKHSNSLAGFNVIGGSGKIFPWVWALDIQPLISQETTELLVKRAEIALKTVTLFKVGEELDKIQPFDVFFFPTALPKVFPSKTAPLFTPEQVNSAVFDANFRPFILQIARAEEILKLILHETYHRAGFDDTFKGLYDNNVTWAKNFAFNFPDEHILLTETIVETTAALVNVIVTAYQAALETGTAESFRSYLAQMWALEKAFSLFQAAKVLYLSGFSSFDQFLDPEHTSIRVEQTTAATEYHIFKAALLDSIEPFLKLFLKSKTDTQPYDARIVGPQLRDLILTACKNSLFKQKITAIIDWLKKIKSSRPC
jgi:hypothetical protein